MNDRKSIKTPCEAVSELVKLMRRQAETPDTNVCRGFVVSGVTLPEPRHPWERWLRTRAHLHPCRRLLRI